MRFQFFFLLPCFSLLLAFILSGFCYKNSTTRTANNNTSVWSGRGLHYYPPVAQSRGWPSSYEHDDHKHTYHKVHTYQVDNSNNMDLYSLLAGLSFASLLGTALVLFATRNTSGRRRRRSIFDDFETEDLYGAPPEGIENIRWNGVETAKDFAPIQLHY